MRLQAPRPMTVDTALKSDSATKTALTFGQVAEQVGMKVPGFAMTTRIFRGTVRKFSLAIWS